MALLTPRQDAPVGVRHSRHAQQLKSTSSCAELSLLYESCAIFLMQSMGLCHLAPFWYSNLPSTAGIRPLLRVCCCMRASWHGHAVWLLAPAVHHALTAAEAVPAIAVVKHTIFSCAHIVLHDPAYPSVFCSCKVPAM